MKVVFWSCWPHGVVLHVQFWSRLSIIGPPEKLCKKWVLANISQILKFSNATACFVLIMVSSFKTFLTSSLKQPMDFDDTFKTTQGSVSSLWLTHQSVKIQLWSLIDQHIFQLLQCNFNMYRFGWGLACSPNLHMCTFMWIHDPCWATNVWLMKSSYHKSDLYISLLTLPTSQLSMCWVLLSTEESIKLKAQQTYCSFSVIKAESHMYKSYQW